MADSSDVIVFDEEYSFAANEISDYGEALIKLIDGYTQNIEIILEDAVKDEKISEKLRAIIELLTPLKPHIESICKEAQSLCTSYVAEIDSTDQFLY